MTNAILRLLILTGAAAGAVAASAQTHPAPAAHRTAPAAQTNAAAPGGDCVTVAGLSPQLPPLPAGAPCPKSLITVSEKITLSPLIGPSVREGFSSLNTDFSLAYVDQVVGTGPLAEPHMWYTVEYTGYLTDGTKFDSSLDHGDKKTISFPYGAHRVIPGWDLGFEGMHIGGKRRLFIPYQLAYGDRGRPPQIPAKSELVFDMTLVAQNATDPDAPPAPPAPPAGTPGTTVLPNSTAPAPASPAAPTATPGTAPTTTPTPTRPPQ